MKILLFDCVLFLQNSYLKFVYLAIILDVSLNSRLDLYVNGADHGWNVNFQMLQYTHN